MLETAINVILGRITNPSTLVMLLLLLISVYLLHHMIQRQRRTLQDFGWYLLEQLEHCEDDHIKRDTVQIKAVSLISETMATMRARECLSGEEALLLEHKAADVIERITDLQDGTVQQREDRRKMRQSSELFGPGGIFDRRGSGRPA